MDIIPHHAFWNCNCLMLFNAYGYNTQNVRVPRLPSCGICHVGLFLKFLLPAPIDFYWTSLAHKCYFHFTYIFFHNGTFFAVVSIWNAWPSTNHTSSLIWPIVTFITDTHKCTWPNIGVTYYTFTITCKQIFHRIIFNSINDYMLQT